MEEKKYIHIYQCKPGYILADDIYDDRGFLIASKGETISENTIKRLIKFRIRQLSVYEPGKGEDAKKEVRKRVSAVDLFNRNYRQSLYTIRQVFNDLKSGKTPDNGRVDMVSKSVHSIVNGIGNIIGCVNDARSMDEYIYTHSINVALYSLLLARWLGLQESECRNVVIAAVLHDIGKAMMPEEILNKKGPLSSDEYELMKSHATIGYKISEGMPQLNDDIRKGILMHHERDDGNGYPSGVTGDKINLYAKIITVTDVFDALTSERVYKRRTNPFDTFDELVRIGYGKFDIQVLTTFLSNISRYYIGAAVKMNNGETGEVIFIAPQCISRPIVSINGNYIDLFKDRHYKIVEVL